MKKDNQTDFNLKLTLKEKSDNFIADLPEGFTNDNFNLENCEEFLKILDRPNFDDIINRYTEALSATELYLFENIACRAEELEKSLKETNDLDSKCAEIEKNTETEAKIISCLEIEASKVEIRYENAKKGYAYAQEVCNAIDSIRKLKTTTDKATNLISKKLFIEAYKILSEGNQESLENIKAAAPYRQKIIDLKAQIRNILLEKFVKSAFTFKEINEETITEELFEIAQNLSNQEDICFMSEKIERRYKRKVKKLLNRILSQSKRTNKNSFKNRFLPKGNSKISITLSNSSFVKFLDFSAGCQATLKNLWNMNLILQQNIKLETFSRGYRSSISLCSGYTLKKSLILLETCEDKIQDFSPQDASILLAKILFFSDFCESISLNTANSLRSKYSDFGSDFLKEMTLNTNVLIAKEIREESWRAVSFSGTIQSVVTRKFIPAIGQNQSLPEMLNTQKTTPKLKDYLRISLDAENDSNRIEKEFSIVKTVVVLLKSISDLIEFSFDKEILHEFCRENVYNVIRYFHLQLHDIFAKGNIKRSAKLKKLTLRNLVFSVHILDMLKLLLTTINRFKESSSKEKLENELEDHIKQLVSKICATVNIKIKSNYEKFNEMCLCLQSNKIDRTSDEFDIPLEAVDIVKNLRQIKGVIVQFLGRKEQEKIEDIIKTSLDNLFGEFNWKNKEHLKEYFYNNLRKIWGQKIGDIFK